MRYYLLRLIAILAVLFFALWPLSALAATSAPISGLEVFPGIPRGNNTVSGITFVGWFDGTGPGGWARCLRAFSCGSWIVIINYKGTAGITGTGNPNPVTIQKGGGRFLTLPNNGGSYSGTMLGGTVTWPKDLNTSIGCGDGIATVIASLLSFSSGGPSSVHGCLDDTHPTMVFPPHIWGTIT